jgi:translation initiation factor 6
MPTGRINFGRIPYLGLFARTTDKITLLPERFKINEHKVLDILGTRTKRTTFLQSPLVGLFSTGNSNGILVPSLIEPKEKQKLVENGIEVTCIEGRYTAMGNLVLVNDHGALVHPDLPDETIERMAKGLGVRIKRGTIAGIKNVGAAGVVTNKGALVHPDITEAEVQLLKQVLKVPVDIGTACSGTKYIGICMLANSHGALTGELSTGPELGRIESALGFI